MKNLNTKNLLAASIASLISVNTFATVPADVDQALTVTFTHPQSVAIDTATGSSATASANTGAATATTWAVQSNNAVKVKFSGTSYNTSGGSTTTPILAKQEVNAKNEKISGAYDQLTTEFGVVLTGTSSTEKDTTTWGGGANPTGESQPDGVGTPTNLINSTGVVGPTESFGAVMPADDGTFTYTLYTKGTGDTSSTQSGAYEAVITTTITAEEKDGSAGVQQ